MGGDGTPVTEVTTTTAGVRCTPLYDVIDAGDNSYTAKMFLNISSVMQADLITINGGLWTVTKAKAIQTGTNTPGYLLELHARGRVAP
jgi:hypothetical protein